MVENACATCTETGGVAKRSVLLVSWLYRIQSGDSAVILLMCVLFPSMSSSGQYADVLVGKKEAIVGYATCEFGSQ
jgi:hypothetical protein